MKQLLNNFYSYFKVHAPFECKKFYNLKCSLYKKYPNGFYNHGPKPKQNSKIQIKKMTDYIARYVSHPALKESRITNIDYLKHEITFYYHPHEDDHLEEPFKSGTQYTTYHVFEFMFRLLMHIPDKNFHMVRYFGFYSNKTTKSLDNVNSLYSVKHLSFKKSNTLWIKFLQKEFHYDPLLCFCGNKMRLNVRLSYYPKGGLP